MTTERSGRILEDHSIPACECPECKNVLDTAASTLPGKTPKPGDITICIYCYNVMEFGDDLQLQTLSKEGRDEFLGTTYAKKVVMAMITAKLHSIIMDKLERKENGRR